MTPTTGKAQKLASAFRSSCAVGISIAAPPEKVWALLTTAAEFPRWNSTVSSLEGSIALGQTLKLKVPISPRTFTPKVTTLEAPRRMVWSDGAAPMFKGVRTFSLTPRADGGTDFEMVEEFTGVMLPMIKGTLPDFGPPFERYAADLKLEAERKA